MKKDLVLKKCLKCGALVEVLKDCTCGDCGIKCCGAQMVSIKANDTDASFEKHVPTYTIEGDKMVVSVNHVMEPDHYIEWIAMVTDDKVTKRFFKPGNAPTVTLHYQKGAKLYSYCNKHSLWASEVK